MYIIINEFHIGPLKKCYFEDKLAYLHTLVCIMYYIKEIYSRLVVKQIQLNLYLKFKEIGLHDCHYFRLFQ